MDYVYSLSKVVDSSWRGSWWIKQEILREKLFKHGDLIGLPEALSGSNKRMKDIEEDDSHGPMLK